MNWLLIFSIALPVVNSHFEMVNAINTTETTTTYSTVPSQNVSNITTVPTTTRFYYTTSTPRSSDSSNGAIIGGIVGGLVLLYLIVATIWWMRNNNICYTTSCINKICPVCFLETCCDCCDQAKYFSNYQQNPHYQDQNHDVECLLCGCCCFNCCTKKLSFEDDSLYTKYLIQKSIDQQGHTTRQNNYYVTSRPIQYQTFNDFKKEHELRKLLEKPQKTLPKFDVKQKQPSVLNAVVIDD